MKSKTLLLWLLSLPYLIWLAAIPLVDLPFDSILHTFTAGFSLVYTFGILFWGIPYTTLVTGILLWSRNRPAKEVYSVLSQSPLLLALITLVEFMIAFVFQALFSGSQPTLLAIMGDFFNSVAYALMAMFGIFVYGYAFVFLSKYLYRTFARLKWIADEEILLDNP